MFLGLVPIVGTHPQFSFQHADYLILILLVDLLKVLVPEDGMVLVNQPAAHRQQLL